MIQIFVLILYVSAIIESSKSVLARFILNRAIKHFSISKFSLCNISDVTYVKQSLSNFNCQATGSGHRVLDVMCPAFDRQPHVTGNFDGYNDIRLLQFLPAAPNLPYYYWTYNPTTQKFQRQKALEEITSPDFDPKKKLIYSFWRGSCCDHGHSTYKYINGKPTLIEETEVKEEDGKVITTLKKLANGKMKLVKKTVEKADEE